MPNISVPSSRTSVKKPKEFITIQYDQYENAKKFITIQYDQYENARNT